MKKFILYLWQLPQNIVGLIILFYNINSMKKVFDDKTNINYYTVKKISDCGISLGNYIIMDKDVYISDTDLKHEHGHQIQSLILGWLYLIVIGIPSFLGNLYSRVFKKDSKWYFSQPWEHWADKLGKVDRNY